MFIYASSWVFDIYNHLTIHCIHCKLWSLTVVHREAICSKSLHRSCSWGSFTFRWSLSHLKPSSSLDITLLIKSLRCTLKCLVLHGFRFDISIHIRTGLRCIVSLLMIQNKQTFNITNQKHHQNHLSWSCYQHQGIYSDKSHDKFIVLYFWWQ